MIFTWKFQRDALERAVMTGVEAGMAAIPVTAVLVESVHWGAVGSSAALAALFAYGKAIMASRVGRSDTASLVD